MTTTVRRERRPSAGPTFEGLGEEAKARGGRWLLAAWLWSDYISSSFVFGSVPLKGTTLTLIALHIPPDLDFAGPPSRSAVVPNDDNDGDGDDDDYDDDDDDPLIKM